MTNEIDENFQTILELIRLKNEYPLSTDSVFEKA